MKVIFNNLEKFESKLSKSKTKDKQIKQVNKENENKDNVKKIERNDSIDLTEMIKKAGFTNDNKAQLIDEDESEQAKSEDDQDMEDDFLNESGNGDESYGGSEDGNYSDGGVF